MNKVETYFSLCAKILVALCSLVGIWFNIFVPGDSHVYWNSLLYFTIQSNFWIAAVCIAGAVMMMKGTRPGRTWSVVKFVFTLSITLTGTVYCFILAPASTGNPFELRSSLVHVYAPILAVFDFFLCSRSLDLRLKDAAWGIIPPLYYLGFASLGYVLNWQFSSGCNYPYFFMNWGSPLGAFGFSSEFPFMGTFWYAAFLCLALLLTGTIFITLSGLMKKSFK